MWLIGTRGTFVGVHNTAQCIQAAIDVSFTRIASSRFPQLHSTGFVTKSRETKINVYNVALVIIYN